MPRPSALVVSGTIHTMDEEAPAAEAFAAVDGRIVAVGTLAEAVAAAGPDAERVHHGEGAIVPGLMDAHNHHAEAGREELFQLSFPPSSSVEKIAEAVRAYAETLTPGEWVVGGLWGSDLVPALSHGGPLALLDAASGDRPVLLTDDSHHNKWANTAAMRAAGILELEHDPHGGRIVRDADGKPTGLLMEAAGALVERHRLSVAPPSEAFHERCSERGIELLAEQGIVGFQDAAANLPLLQALARLDAQGRLKAWVTTSVLINDNIFGNELVGEELMARAAEYASEHHRPAWSKIFLDGVPPAHNAAFLSPYRVDEAHGHHHLGSTLMDLSELRGWLATAQRHGLGVKIHCTGDASVRQVLDAVEAERAEGNQTPVHIAHGQFVSPQDRPRFARLGVVAEISPFLWFPGLIADVLQAVVDEETFADLHPNRDLLDEGATLAVGSDWPVSESPNPWVAVSGLVTRRDPSGAYPGVLAPQQAISREEAVRAITAASADAMGLGDVTGRLRVGNSADFVLLNQDPFAVPEEDIASTRADETWFAGERVFKRA